MAAANSYYLDITAEICPLTFVRTKLTIEKMKPGEVLEVRLQGAEPLRNVPRSVTELGHMVISVTPEPGQGTTGIHRLLLRKTGVA